MVLIPCHVTRFYIWVGGSSLKMQCHDIMITLRETVFPKKCTEMAKIQLLYGHTTPTSSLCMHGCQVGGILSVFSHTPQC